MAKLMKQYSASLTVRQSPKTNYCAAQKHPYLLPLLQLSSPLRLKWHALILIQPFIVHVYNEHRNYHLDGSTGNHHFSQKEEKGEYV